jgi:ribokinase
MRTARRKSKGDKVSILVVGSANVDCTLRLDRLPTAGETVTANSFDQIVGGKGINQAVAAARAGGSVALIACVGDDPNGHMLRTALETETIEIDHLSVVPAPSGVAVVMTVAGGNNLIAIVPGANALLRPAMLRPEQFAGRKIILCQLETPLDTVLRAAELADAQGATFILDPAPARTLPRALLGRVDWLTPNESEARSLLDRPQGEIEPVAAAREIRAMGVGHVIIKLGSRGSLLLGKDDEPIFIAAHDVAGVDTTAAGDCFNGAFAVALGEGARPEDAARFASAASALAVTRHGARDAMPFRPEIDRLLSLPSATAIGPGDRPG